VQSGEQDIIPLARAVLRVTSLPSSADPARFRDRLCLDHTTAED